MPLSPLPLLSLLSLLSLLLTSTLTRAITTCRDLDRREECLRYREECEWDGDEATCRSARPCREWNDRPLACLERAYCHFDHVTGLCRLRETARVGLLRGHALGHGEEGGGEEEDTSPTDDPNVTIPIIPDPPKGEGPPPLEISFEKYVQQNPTLCPGTPTAPCVIKPGVRVAATAKDVDVRSLTVLGALRIEAGVKGGASRLRVSCAFIAVINGTASLKMRAVAPRSSLTVYIRQGNDESRADAPPCPSWASGKALATCLTRGGRFVGALYGADIEITGQTIKNTWALLKEPLNVNDNTLALDRDVSDWKAGDTIVVAPTDFPEPTSVTDVKPTPIRVGPQVFTIKAVLPKNRVQINEVSKDRVNGNASTGVQGEVIYLNRSVLITGDDFTQRWAPIPPNPWPPYSTQKYADSTAKIEGLHTFVAYGGTLKMRYASVTKAGQRGAIGRYPIHLHLLQDCPTCEVIGCSIVDSQQRGLTVHWTHRARLEQNVLYMVRGAGVYIEDGAEMDNKLLNNVVLCHSPRSPKTILSGNTWTPDGEAACALPDPQNEWGDPSIEFGGCRILGTDNSQADCFQQSGIWSLSLTNDFIGNRVANVYNAIYFQSTNFKDGRRDVNFQLVRPMNNQAGKFVSNVCHSNYRFGFYPDENYPRMLNRSVDGTSGRVGDITTVCTDNVLNLFSGWCSVRAYKLDGADNGQFPAATVVDGLDYFNGYVGMYDISDVAFQRMRSYSNQNGFYLKNTKNFVDHTTSLIADATFHYDHTDAFGNFYVDDQVRMAQLLVGLPGSSSAIVLERVVLKGRTRVAIGLNQEAKSPNKRNSPITDDGALASAEVVLVQVDFSGIVESWPNQGDNPVAWIKFGVLDGNPITGCVVTRDGSLCGGREKEPGGARCKEWRSVQSKYNTHLLALKNSPCITASSLSPDWQRRFDDGVVCEVETRRLNIWGSDQGDLVLLPSGCTDESKCGFTMEWMAFNRVGNKSDQAGNERRFCQGYSAVVIPNEELSGVNDRNPWTIQRAGGKDLDVTAVTALEFSDPIWGVRFPRVDTINLVLKGLGSCVAKSSDSRKYITYEGPVTRGGGSCVELWG